MLGHLWLVDVLLKRQGGENVGLFLRISNCFLHGVFDMFHHLPRFAAILFCSFGAVDLEDLNAESELFERRDL